LRQDERGCGPTGLYPSRAGRGGYPQMSRYRSRILDFLFKFWMMPNAIPAVQIFDIFSVSILKMKL
jgi:hypothetical protein